MDPEKPINTLILDAGPMIKNVPTISTLLAKSERIVTTPAIITEIKDAATRSRIETSLRPFLELRNPKPESVKFVQDFARRTADLAVLSKPDIQILALAYEIECERNGGDWRLRRVPGQKRTNGPPRSTQKSEERPQDSSKPKEEVPQETVSSEEKPDSAHDGEADVSQKSQPRKINDVMEGQENASAVEQNVSNIDMSRDSDHFSGTSRPIETDANAQEDSASDQEASASSDSEGWITPSNIKRHQNKNSTPSASQQPEPKTMQVATITTDFAMQNVLLQVNLNLLSPSMQRVKHLKTFILRCHACFQTTKDMTKQFCPRCGQPALTRVACSTNANGEFKLHLKRNMQWNTRGDRFSVPKPMSGAANGKAQGGGKGGWGNELILAEDQKEYVRAVAQEKRQKQRDLMDEDFLPSILSGKRGDGREGGRPRVGAGRNINSRKR